MASDTLVATSRTRTRTRTLTLLLVGLLLGAALDTALTTYLPIRVGMAIDAATVVAIAFKWRTVAVGVAVGALCSELFLLWLSHAAAVGSS